MARGTPYHTGDASIKQGVYTKVADREWTLKEITRFISVDAAGQPIFKEIGGRLVIQLEFGTVQGTPVPCSASPAEFWAIVNAFGVDVGSVTQPQFKMTSESLDRAKVAVNKSGQTIFAPSKNGWINGNRIPAALPPAGNYVVKFVGAHRFDRKPDDLTFEQRNGINGEYSSLVFDFEILRSAFSRPTAFDGYVVSIFMPNPFCDSYVDQEGKLLKAVELGVPLYARDERSGGIPLSAKRWDKFAQYFAPNMFTHDWQVDPAQSEYNVCEVLQPQYVYVGEAKKAGREVIVYWKDKTKGTGRTIDMLDVPNFNDLPEAPVIQLDMPEETPKETAVTLGSLVTTINTRWPGIEIFDTTGPHVVFTEAGVVWAKETFGKENSPWQRAGLPMGKDKPALHQLTEEQLAKLIAEIESQYPDPAQKEW